MDRSKVRRKRGLKITPAVHSFPRAWSASATSGSIPFWQCFRTLEGQRGFPVKKDTVRSLSNRAFEGYFTFVKEKTVSKLQVRE